MNVFVIAILVLVLAGYTRVVNFGAVSRWPKNLVTGMNPR